jgi:bisphosphoglycerate-independent phosphoglycerate mutase (AlkP superfamily)
MGAFERGWLPEWLASEATEIHEFHDLDTNAQAITFSIENVEAFSWPKECKPAITVKRPLLETEKFPHVTFFFNAGADAPFPGEDRYLAISPKEVPTYDKKPQMSAPDLAFEVWRRLEEYDAVIMNFANPDMVGHTGVVEAGVHAVETIDLGVRLIVEKVLALVEALNHNLNNLE